MFKKIAQIIFFVVFVIVTYFAMQACGFKVDMLQKGIKDSLFFLTAMFPPDWTVFKSMLEPALQTLSLAILGTLLGSVVSFVIAIFAASNLSNKWVKLLVRSFISIERSIPELFILLILIAAYGLGALSAVLALTIGCIGMLGKLFADAIEETPTSLIESLQAAGASKIQIIYYGILPDVFPKFLSYALFRLEINIRLSVMLGAVGAGGIGFELDYAFSMLQYNRALSSLIIILILVIVVEQFSAYTRKRLLINQI